jgi:hypothetical protein
VLTVSLPAVAQLDGADEESAALIKALLVQDQLDARSSYGDPYHDDGADDIPKPRRGRKTEPTNDEEMDDDFIPVSVQRELKLRGLVPCTFILSSNCCF